MQEGAAALAEADEKPSLVLLSPVRPSDPFFVPQSTPLVAATSVTDPLITLKLKELELRVKME